MDFFYLIPIASALGAYGEQHEIPAWVAVAGVLKGLAEFHLGGGHDSVALARRGVADRQKKYSVLSSQWIVSRGSMSRGETV
jgi:hypothetical protein